VDYNNTVIRKGFVNVGNGQVHYRTAGSGPPIIVLHDSPRSSVLHIPQLAAFSDTFTVIAIDTPGYGNSTPLSPDPRPEIPDFGKALADTIRAFGVDRCPVYGFHTSSKITLDFAANQPDCVAVAILDGLSIPPGEPDSGFIDQYMKPFLVTDDGAYLAAEWTRVRDFQRWFPWFAKTQVSRQNSPQRDMTYMHEYCMDLLMAGPHFSDAYGAAMRYKPKPVIPTITSRTIFMAKEDDVLYTYLDSLPDPMPKSCSIERLTSDKKKWRSRLRAIFEEYADFEDAANFAPPDPFTKDSKNGEIVNSYVDLDYGQMLVRRAGNGSGRPIIYLHELPGSCRAETTLLSALSQDRPVYGFDLPGCNDSDPLSKPTSESYANAIVQAMNVLSLQNADIIAESTATPLALRLVHEYSTKVNKLILDGIVLPQDALRTELKVNYCADLRPQMDGSHLHRCWHMLRDQAIAWPWYDGGTSAIRKITPNLNGQRLHTRLVDTLKQWEHYTDAIQAAFDFDGSAFLSDLPQQTLVCVAEDDVRYRWANQTVNLLKNGQTRVRPEIAADRARIFLDFLDG